jgi:Tfp pilus assembly protein PilX
MGVLMGWIVAAPSIPNDVGGKYVAGAYIVFILLLLIYVAIMGMKLARIERDLTEIAAIAEQRKDDAVAAEAAPAEVKS